MSVYLFTLILFIIAWILSKDRIFKSYPFLYILGLILLLIASLKDISVGTDSFNYFDNFYYVEYYENDRIFKGLQRFWYFYNLILNKISNYTLFLTISYSINLIGIIYLIRSNSKDKVLSILIYYLFFFLASLNVMRQYVAIGIFSIGLTFLSNKLYKKYILSILIASFFHYSAILMLPLIWLNKLKINKLRDISLVLGSFYIGFFMSVMKPVVMAMILITGLNDGSSIYLEEWGEGERNIITNLIINLVFIVFYIVNKDNKQILFIKMWLVYVILNNLFGAAGQGNRLFTYLLLGMIIAVPDVLKNLKNKHIQWTLILIFLIYGIGYWYSILSSGNGEVVPYVVR